ncbi:putative Fe2OG dioxygenase domain-containing protein [Seiridium unicorne]|uniref:Fe2OG dioxygenase domain-containing protein n=1 Tax=Seiridium unicorne TaxID=138068 RepID=A0ABR2UFT0_9PEZI
MPSSNPPHQPLDTSKQASLKVIDLHKLESGSTSEHASLLRVSIEDGFFYLKLVENPERPLQEYSAGIFRLSEDMFNHDPAVKDLFDVDKISHNKTNGYKPKGRNIVSKDGTRDGFESWVLPRDGLFQLENTPFPHPPVVAATITTLRGIVTELESAAQTILRSLSVSLSLQQGQRFEEFHRPSRPASHILRLLKYHADGRIDIGSVPQTPHTDLGSLTFVFTSTPGLQVLPAVTHSPGGKPATEADWRYVPPLEGHAIVNLGDCMSKMTNGLFKSVLHRVGPLPGHPMPERYSFAYLMRPEDSTPLRALDSRLILPPRDNEDVVTSGEWIQSKFKALRGVHDAKNGDHILTGGRGVLI